MFDTLCASLLCGEESSSSGDVRVQEEKNNCKRDWLHEEENAIANVVRNKTQSEFPALYVGGIVRVEPILSIPATISRTGILADVVRTCFVLFRVLGPSRQLGKIADER